MTWLQRPIKTYYKDDQAKRFSKTFTSIPEKTLPLQRIYPMAL
jgi:hypothetical protein